MGDSGDACFGEGSVLVGATLEAIEEAYPIYLYSGLEVSGSTELSSLCSCSDSSRP